MKQINFILIGLLAIGGLLFSGFMFADSPTKVPSQITKALLNGNSDELSEYFNTNLELVMLEKTDICTKKQAKLIVENFFDFNKPSDFKVVYEGQQSDALHVMGELLTDSNKKYNVYFLVKNSDEQVVITQFKIEVQ